MSAASRRTNQQVHVSFGTDSQILRRIHCSKEFASVARQKGWSANFFFGLFIKSGKINQSVLSICHQ
jgi:hypothetical protein